MTSFGRKFSLATITIDGIKSLLQLHVMDVQNTCRNTYLSPNKSYGKSYDLFVIESGEFVKFALAVICCLIYHRKSVGRN